MKLIAASSVDVAIGFLHAGYVSASPRTMSPFRWAEAIFDSDYGPLQNPEFQIDMIQALQLKSETLSAATQTTASGAILQPFTQIGNWPTLLLGVASIFVFLVLLYLSKDTVARQNHWGGLFPVLMIVAFLTTTCGTEIPEAPWENLQRQEFEDPQAATFAILHGILGPALENGNLRELNPASVLEEVAVPAAELTAGMQYALNAYGLDGWGREFRIEMDGTNITATSAGADGAFDTDDDLVANLEKRDNSNFDIPTVVYYAKHDNDLFVLFHRYRGDYFEFHNEALAQELTGSDLFDCISSRYILFHYPDELMQTIESTYKNLNPSASSNSLVLQRLRF